MVVVVVVHSVFAYVLHFDNKFWHERQITAYLKYIEPVNQLLKELPQYVIWSCTTSINSHITYMCIWLLLFRLFLISSRPTYMSGTRRGIQRWNQSRFLWPDTTDNLLWNRSLTGWLTGKNCQLLTGRLTSKITTFKSDNDMWNRKNSSIHYSKTALCW